MRPMPERPYVINLKNNPITIYRYRMHQEDLAKQFGRWYPQSHGGGKTVCLLGIRADESLQRYSGFLNKRYGYKDECWITRQFKGVWCASPLYDWGRLRRVARRVQSTGTTTTAVRPVLQSGAEGVADARGLPVQRLFQGRAEPVPHQRSADLGQAGGARARGANFAAITATRRRWLPQRHAAAGLYVGGVHAFSAGYAARPAAQQLHPQISDVHRVLARDGRRSGRGDHPRAGGARLRRAAQRRVELHAKKKTRVVFVGKIPDDTDDIRTTKDIPSWKRMCYAF